MRPLFGEVRSRADVDDDAFGLLALALLPDVGPRTVHAVLERGRPGEVLSRPEDLGEPLPARAREALRSGEALRAAEAQAAAAARKGFAIVGWDQPSYPERLRQIYDPPPVLFVRGTLPPAGDEAVAVVGTRRATGDGRTLARALSREVAAAGAVVVSGLARGIDSAAHRGALDAAGLTVAVLGSGLDRLYPPENEPLAEEIAGRGAVVTELPLGRGPRPEHFPRRNRIIAGWSRAVVVVEAAERSGALVTARLSLDEGREVFAVPGHPLQPGSAGTNALIRDGALLVRGGRDVIEALGLAPAPAAEAETADPLLAALGREAPVGLDELRARAGLETPALLARLTELEMEGRVRRLPGPLYVRR